MRLVSVLDGIVINLAAPFGEIACSLSRSEPTDHPVTGYTDGGVSATVIRLRKRGEILPIRGYVADMGSWPTHKEPSGGASR